jgi:single-stranded DNA-binding protein
VIEVLMAGKLVGKPEARTSKSGRTFVTAKLRVADGGEDTHFVRLTAFSDTVGAALLALDDGDAAAVAGTLKPGAWVDRDGAAKPNLDVVVAQVLTVYHLKRRRDAVQGTCEPADTEPPSAQRTASPAPGYGRRSRAPRPEATPPDADGYIDFGEASDDAWLRGKSR